MGTRPEPPRSTMHEFMPSDSQHMRICLLLLFVRNRPDGAHVEAEVAC